MFHTFRNKDLHSTVCPSKFWIVLWQISTLGAICPQEILIIFLDIYQDIDSVLLLSRNFPVGLAFTLVLTLMLKIVGYTVNSNCGDIPLHPDLVYRSPPVMPLDFCSAEKFYSFKAEPLFTSIQRRKSWCKRMNKNFMWKTLEQEINLLEHHKVVKFLHNYLIWALIYLNKLDASAGLTQTFFWLSFIWLYFFLLFCPLYFTLGIKGLKA